MDAQILHLCKSTGEHQSLLPLSFSFSNATATATLASLPHQSLLSLASLHASALNISGCPSTLDLLPLTSRHTDPLSRGPNGKGPMLGAQTSGHGSWRLAWRCPCQWATHRPTYLVISLVAGRTWGVFLHIRPSMRRYWSRMRQSSLMSWCGRSCAWAEEVAG